MFFLNPRPPMINSSRPRFVASPWKNATTKDSQQQRPLAQHRDANVCAPARACTCTCSRERERKRERNLWIIRECVRGFVFGHPGFVQPADKARRIMIHYQPVIKIRRRTGAIHRDWNTHRGTKTFLLFFLSLFSLLPRRERRWLIAVRLLSTSMHTGPCDGRMRGPGESRAPTSSPPFPPLSLLSKNGRNS